MPIRVDTGGVGIHRTGASSPTARRTARSRAGAKPEQMAVNELSGVERVYGVAAVDRALLLRSGRKLIKLSER